MTSRPLQTLNQLLEQLSVTHRLKTADAASAASLKSDESFVLDTCLRQLRIDLHSAAVNCPPGMERLHGRQAYQLLLEIATGLRSAIPGETNVFGQFRKAWQTFMEYGDQSVIHSLSPLMTHLFADTRSIRKKWLEGIGGASYGSLVRRLINPERKDNILFVGTGELMQSMLPFFARYAVGAWNYRSSGRASDAIHYHFSPEQGEAAAAWADHVILTTPCDPENDLRWQQWVRTTSPGSVVHLGHRAHQPMNWSSRVAAYNLEDVFSLRRRQSHQRSSQIEQAQAECIMLATRLTDAHSDGSLKNDKLAAA